MANCTVVPGTLAKRVPSLLTRGAFGLAPSGLRLVCPWAVKHAARPRTRAGRREGERRMEIGKCKKGRVHPKKFGATRRLTFCRRKTYTASTAWCQTVNIRGNFILCAGYQHGTVPSFFEKCRSNPGKTSRPPLQRPLAAAWLHGSFRQCWRRFDVLPSDQTSDLKF